MTRQFQANQATWCSQLPGIDGATEKKAFHIADWDSHAGFCSSPKLSNLDRALKRLQLLTYPFGHPRPEDYAVSTIVHSWLRAKCQCLSSPQNDYSTDQH